MNLYIDHISRAIIDIRLRNSLVIVCFVSQQQRFVGIAENAGICKRKLHVGLGFILHHDLQKLHGTFNLSLKEEQPCNLRFAATKCDSSWLNPQEFLNPLLIAEVFFKMVHIPRTAPSLKVRHLQQI
jgi:hypothetical protein